MYVVGWGVHGANFIGRGHGEAFSALWRELVILSTLPDGCVCVSLAAKCSTGRNPGASGSSLGRMPHFQDGSWCWSLLVMGFCVIVHDVESSRWHIIDNAWLGLDS